MAAGNISCFLIDAEDDENDATAFPAENSYFTEKVGLLNKALQLEYVI